MKRNKSIVILFLVIISLPFVFSDKKGGALSEDENRYLATAPIWSVHKGLKSEIENWINDNAGGRTWLRNFYNYMNVNVLKEKRVGETYFSGDWAYLVAPAVIGYLQHTDIMDEDAQRQFLENYKKVKKRLEQKDIKMCATVFPHKVDIYPENINRDVLEIHKKSQLDIFSEMAQDEELHFKVLKEEMLKAKNQGTLVYSKAYDTAHWNNQGALIGYQAFMQQVKELVPEVRILEKQDFNITPLKREKIYNMRVYSEEDYEYNPKEQNAEQDQKWFTDNNYSSSDMWQSYRYYKNGDDSLPKILIIGDSFTWMFLLPWIAESFSETVFIHQLDAENMQAVIDLVKPDIVSFTGLHNCVSASINVLG